MKNPYYKKLREEGVYITPLLKAIIRILKSAKGPLSVNEIRHILNKKELNPNKTTLYRQLTKLAEIEAVQESLFTDEVRRYCLVTDKRHHHHFICQNCGYAEELPRETCGYVENNLTDSYIDRGFEVITHTLEIEGLCKNCTS